MTCATTDPLVATLFALECRNHGPGVVLIVPRGPFVGLIGPSNHFDRLECAINVMVPPTEFARHALFSLEVDDSLAILAELGFDRLPSRINGASALRVALIDTEAESQRLSLEQIRHFNRHLFEAM